MANEAPSTADVAGWEFHKQFFALKELVKLLGEKNLASDV